MASTLENALRLVKPGEMVVSLTDILDKLGNKITAEEKEQLLIDREIEKLEKFFGGVAEMDKLPDAVFIVDTHREDVAVREAVRMGVPVVGMVDSNGDPEIVDYVIPVNDDAVKSIELVVNLITDAVEEGIKRGKEAEAKSDGTEVQPKLRTKTKPKTKKVEKNEV